MSAIDWSHVEDLAEVAYRADHTILSGYDYGCGFRAGYLAGRASLTDDPATPYTEQETTKVEERPDDDPAPVATCNGRDCGGRPHE